jgi:toxin ParE1/3/4
MARLRLSYAARMDLRQIAAYTRDRWGTKQALSYVTQLEKAFERVGKMTRLGKPVLGLEETYRALNVGSHVVFYRAENDAILIVRILHQRMLPKLPME